MAKRKGRVSWYTTDSLKEEVKQSKRPEYDEDGVLIDDTTQSFDFGWGSSLSSKKQSREKWDEDWNNNYNSNKWTGYTNYRPVQLSYRYVQQIVNALASQHKISVSIGNTWSTNLEKKELKYNPASLVYGTKAELLATLLHEIGKLRYSDDITTITQGPILKKYGFLAHHALAPFEELRIDHRMISSYPSAPEIYEAQEPSLIAVVKKYSELSDAYVATVELAAKQSIANQLHDLTYSKKMDAMEMNMRVELIKAKIRQDPSLDITKELENLLHSQEAGSSSADKIQAVFGVRTEAEVWQIVADYMKRVAEKENLWDFVASTYANAYNLMSLPKDTLKSVRTLLDRITATEPSLRKTPTLATTQAVEDEMEAGVFPVIEDLLKGAKEGPQETQNMLGGQTARDVEKTLKQLMNRKMSETGVVDENGNVQGIGGKKTGGSLSGPTESTTLPEWAKGEYKTLKMSVISEIKSLTRKLTFLRREEASLKQVFHQRRGKLDMKRLYRAPLGIRSLFKRKMETQDTIRSFAFSLVVDISGSMAGDRMINTVRGLITLAEVFKEMDIPYELIVFGSNATTVKRFDQQLDKTLEESIGGLVMANGGGTNLHHGLNKVTIGKRAEKNKIVVMLTDGGVGEPRQFDEKYFLPWQKKGIKSLAFGIELDKYYDQEIKQLVMGTGKGIENAAMLPNEFSSLIKSLIKRKK